ncbi:hypothetical protein ZIOFF_058513 [Zingiber officinale]|uniref:Protein FAR1-RELATED SEQUENCE n=1 Tax=Zingiber officinale TaxID=94328 RepID=A0A8J5KAV0_ZINOF|nr:hypothetical protein ZIOFF_058513 [Zingiber officinale]
MYEFPHLYVGYGRGQWLDSITVSVEAGGYENLPFDERKCRNFISEVRRLRLGDGDAEALSNYFCRMQSRNSNFFYVLDLDEESRIRNVFWADARCRAAYDYFSDVVTFDTTYLTNSYDMSFAPFVGVNHHGQSILLGCGLLSSKDSKTFIWLFKSWLTCMLGRAPKAIITDQCRAMAIAIEEIFPNSHHRLCLWYIMKKLPAKFGGHAQYKMIKKQLKNIVYNSLTVDECDERWMTMIEDFNLENNDWLKSLYEQRNKWIPVYVKDKFWAGMSTSQRSESVNAFFDEYVHSKTSLKQFVEQYDNALKKKIEKEKHLDFGSFNSMIPVITDYPIERQFQNFYTNNLFKLFQDEIRGLMFCNTSLVRQEGVAFIFEVVETLLEKNGDPIRDASFRVHYTELDCQVKCLCHLFEFRGILCRSSRAQRAQSIARIEELLLEDQNVKRRREKLQKQQALLSKITCQLSAHDNRPSAASWSNGDTEIESNPRRNAASGDDWRSAFDADQSVTLSRGHPDQKVPIAVVVLDTVTRPRMVRPV